MPTLHRVLPYSLIWTPRSITLPRSRCACGVKRVGIKYLNKRKYCVGTEPSALVYIGILVTSATTGHDGSVVSALASQAKGRGSTPSCGTSFFPQVFSIFPFQPLWLVDWTTGMDVDHFFFFQELTSYIQ